MSRDLRITYTCHPLDAVLACYLRVHARNFRVPLSDDLLKSRAIHPSTIRLHKLFLWASARA